MERRLINLTPHTVNIGILAVLPHGVVARCSEITTPDDRISIPGISFVNRHYGNVENLPEESDEFLYIVSAQVRATKPWRLDLASPGDLLRDEAGRVIGCANLVINPE